MVRGAVSKGLQYLRSVAGEAGLKKACRKCVRFIILGRSRVGSNLLRGLLNSHPGVVAYGEVFRSRDSMDWDHVGLLQSPRMREERESDPGAFIRKRVFRRYPRGAKALGFKIFYYHAQDESQRNVWECLRMDKNLRVVHIKRRNILETHLSRRRAEMTGLWVDAVGKTENDVRVELDYQECLSDFARTRRLEEEFSKLFSEHPQLEIFYEELSASMDHEIRRVFEFLGLPDHPVKPSTRKQSRRPVAEVVVNYQELKAKFAGTRWAEFFVD